MHRRRSILTLAATATAVAASAGAGPAWGQDPGAPDGGDAPDDLPTALRRFRALPGTKSFLIHVGPGGALGRAAHRPDRLLFIASAYKTFVLAQYLRDVEAGLLSETEQLPVDDAVRTLGSPVLMHLAGTTQARAVLDAMMAYSDNTATDLATRKVGADRVRALIAAAGLPSIRIPDTTRLFASYLFGAAPGTDYGWPGIIEAAENPPGPVRPPLNDVITLAGTARDFVSWYEQALGGAFFAKTETLALFKRAQGTSAQIPLAVPPDTLAYVKGGEVASLFGFNAKSLAGQVVVGGAQPVPVTFCFAVNWDGPLSEFASVEEAFFAAIRAALGAIKRSAA